MQLSINKSNFSTTTRLDKQQLPKRKLKKLRRLARRRNQR
jgi:hypothetical protein